MRVDKKLLAFFLLFALIFLIDGTYLAAQTTGKIKGRVIEQRSGEPLIGASVVVEGTNRGAATDANGEYVILNMYPGKYNLVFRMMGYSTRKVADVAISVNRTVTVDAQLQDEVLAGEEIVVTASAIGIKKDQTSSLRNVSAESCETLPIPDVDGG